MIAVLTVSPQSLADLSASRVLRKMAAEHELVLLGGHDAAPRVLRTVRALLPRHRVVALLLDGVPSHHERNLIDELLDIGYLPVVLTTGEPDADEFSRWLKADCVVTAQAVTS